MASNLVELAREVGGDELAERVERLKGEIEDVEQLIEAEQVEGKELEMQLKEQTGIDEDTIESLDLKAKRELASEFGIREETTNGRIPVAGRSNFEDFESEPVEQSSNRSSGRTVTEEVEIPAPGRSNESSTTSTVEYEDTNPTMEEMTNWKRDMHQSFIEENRRQQERANRRREEQESTPIFTGYTNIEDIDGIDEDSDVPVAGRRNKDDDE